MIEQHAETRNPWGLGQDDHPVGDPITDAEERRLWEGAFRGTPELTGLWWHPRMSFESVPEDLR
jgi:hypothetical protein